MLSCKQSLVRVLVVDDHELTRFSLKLALSAQKNIELVGLASNGQEAIDVFKLKRPHVIVMDLQMPVLDGLSASKQIKEIDPSTQIIAYTSVEDPQTEVIGQTAKIDAFCQKDTATKDLINLIQELGDDTEVNWARKNLTAYGELQFKGAKLPKTLASQLLFYQGKYA